MLSSLICQPITRYLTTAVAIVPSAMFIRRIYQILKYTVSDHNLPPYPSCHELRIVIGAYQEDDGENPEYKAVDLYLGDRMTSLSRRLQVKKAFDMKKPVTTLAINDEVVDFFENIQGRWKLILVPARPSNVWHLKYIRAYELTYDKKHQDKVVNSYLPYILEKAKAIKEEKKAIQLYAVDCEWGISEHVFEFDHPVTFKNLAVDTEIKEAVLDDLNTFLHAAQFYRRNEKPWKRGYLLYGPAGTGKSSLIAAMANHMNYDIYDLDLSRFSVQPEALWSMAPYIPSRSIVVVEDIDVAFKIQNQELKKGEVSLSVLLEEFWDGCGEERVIVFTANDKNMLDSQFFRLGLIDMHIHLSGCTSSAFRQLLQNHFGTQNYILVDEIERQLQDVEVSIGEVSAHLLKSNDPDVSLRALVRFLREKRTIGIQ